MPGLLPCVTVIGGGLAGPEAAWQAAHQGCRVRLFEMRPRLSTPAHKTAGLGELVCSNSLKSEAPGSAPWQLKRELRASGSLLLACAEATRIPGGQALTVDRLRFSAEIERRLLSEPRIELRREEVRAPDSSCGPVIIASGPLSSEPLAAELARLAGSAHLYFYDAISPIVAADSLDLDFAFAASRYGRGGDDYLNCPLNREEYERFCQALRAAESYPLHAFEQSRYFEACLPLEELARRGSDTLRYGPLKPIGLPDPRTGRLPYAVLQLRREDQRAGAYNLVGCQNHLRFADQARVLRLIPALHQAEFLRLGQVHRNTYLNAPAVLTPALALRRHPAIHVAGQLCGTEGYIEAIATGFLAGTLAARRALGLAAAPPPRASALGSLIAYMQSADPASYAPANMTFDLLPPLEAKPEGARLARTERHELICQAAMGAHIAWWCEHAPGKFEDGQKAHAPASENAAGEIAAQAASQP